MKDFPLVGMMNPWNGHEGGPGPIPDLFWNRFEIDLGCFGKQFKAYTENMAFIDDSDSFSRVSNLVDGRQRNSLELVSANVAS